MSKTRIAPFEKLELKIYGYTLPDLPTHEGSVKVGETAQDSVEKRIVQQTGTAGVKPQLLFNKPALKNDGTLFHDKELHAYFRLRGIKRTILNRQASEWFHFGDVSKAEVMTDDFIRRDYDAVQIGDGRKDYILRREQHNAVCETLEYYDNPIHGPEFLWNAKPRFGKTLTTYDFARKLNAINILIVTNRPAIANSWFDDFMDFISWQEPGLKFVSETDALVGKAMTRDEYLTYINTTKDENPRCIAFLSLQDLKGAKFAGGEYEKLRWVGGINWDLLVIDEAHEGIDTQKTDRAFDKINRKFTLHLSGTPFKAIANQKFHQEQIFNWSYLDEQKAKVEWDEAKDGTNPYEGLPTLSLFTYQMSKVIENRVAQGINLENEINVDYAFDLNEFFSTKDDGTFVYESDVRRFLDNLAEGKFPFAEGEHRQHLNHTFWLLPRVASAKALQKMLKNHPFFKQFEVVLAAGDGVSLEEEDSLESLNTSAINERQNKRSFDRVKQAIATHERTITLSVTQLTTGVTIKEWTAVLMLSNIKSPSLYFQAAFRAQNPFEFQDEKTKQWYRKENAYVFDFAPERTLILFDEFANNLKGQRPVTTGERKDSIKELINFFPVIAEDDDGTMQELDPEEVLTIPSHIKASQVVKQGFMSNLLFANISAIFSAPKELKELLEKISPEKNKRLTEKKPINVTDPMLNDDGEVEVPPDLVINTTNGLFGEGIYKTNVDATLAKVAGIGDRMKAAQEIAKSAVGSLKDGFAKTKDAYDLTKKALDDVVKTTETALTGKIEETLYQHEEAKRTAQETFKKEVAALPTPEAVEERTRQFEEEQKELEQTLVKAIQDDVQAAAEEVVEKQIKKQEEAKKKTTEDDVRDHLRGFARTIPAFLMAYGNEGTTLANFDQNIDEPTFLELTSITLEEFRKLRDGFDYTDDDGQLKTLPGLFDEVVFNASVQEFFAIKKKLADYLRSGQSEDIFDYIPPQKTNQIFTPKRVVKMVVDLLQKQAPELFTRIDSTFIDLYSKSGLFLTEIAKRLFVGLKDEIPDETERITWILENQLYGCAPSNLIYNMVKNYMFAGYPNVNSGHLIELDLTEAAEQGKVAKALQKGIGAKVKFDVVIGNPPYQEADGSGASTDAAMPVYQKFVDSAKQLGPTYLSMIIPAKWMVGGRGLKKFREEMYEDNRVRTIVDFEDAKECFPGLHIDGGVCYFLWDRSYRGDVNYVFTSNDGTVTVANRALANPYSEYVIRDNRVLGILEKCRTNDSFSDIVSSTRPFGIRKGLFNEPERYENHQLQDVSFRNSTRIFGVKGIKGGAKRVVGYVSTESIQVGVESIDKYKLFFTTSYSTDAVIPPAIISAGPNEISTETFLMIGPFEDKSQRDNCQKYMETKFFRFLLFHGKGTMQVTKSVFALIPLMDFSRSWTDDDLYKKYCLTKTEIAFIESIFTS